MRKRKVTFACGHTGTLTFFDKSTNADEYVKKCKSNICQDCKDAKQWEDED
jgi:hypothetical protein